MKKLDLTIKDSCISFVVAYLLSQLLIVLFVLTGSVFFEIFGKNYNILNTFLKTAFGYLILTAILNISLVLTFLFFNKNKENKIIEKVNIKKISLYIAIGLISYILLYPAISLIDILLTNIGLPVQNLPYELNSTNYLISIFSLVIFPAVCEELIFRGIIFKGLKKYGKVFSIVVSALMFAIFHMSVRQFIYPLIMGSLLAVIMYYENNIIYCIIVHLLNNFTTLTLSYLGINLIWINPLYIAMAIIFIVLFISLLLYFVFKHKNNYEKTKTTSVDKKSIILSFSLMIIFYVINFISVF